MLEPANEDEVGDDDDGCVSESGSEGWEDVSHSDLDDGEDEEEETEEKEGEKFMTLEDKKAKAKEVTMSRILSDADFRYYSSFKFPHELISHESVVVDKWPYVRLVFYFH